MARLLITGGAGFIGSHTCVVLLEAGHDLVVLDNFANSSPIALDRVQKLAGRGLQCIEGDVRDTAALKQLFADSTAADSPIEAVIHFAGLKAVGESVANPLRYWDVNVAGSLALLSAMDANGCRTLVFSSSATLYGFPESVPIPETAPVLPINPYGHTKAAVERILNDVSASAPGTWRIACLRYFNPVGAHASGRIGEDPNGIPNNLFPFVSQVAIGRQEKLNVFGGDWPTRDGSGVRDYIHVMDLAEGHLAALNCLLAEAPQLLTLNLGSGIGASVLEVIQAFEKASDREVPYQVVARRQGDAAITVADPELAANRLGWRTQRTLIDICRDGWAWQSANPNGYREAP
ncbi:UDP-glucose 4-epimerase GalE [Synechococcus sp. MIT S9503]|uniref:UDP-glucose 4-epimerase GalE n=1 Tax=Synechococcus sp. MIT S9503 TaxID=3082547 RepID=UPI0039A63456